jgi:predicted nucleic acid-binding protein
LIVVDTSVLSLAFRRNRRRGPTVHPASARFGEAIRQGVPLVVPGICLQELLSGVRDREQFRRLTRLMAPFPVVLASREHHVAAAGVANDCRAAGFAVATVDALIAALAIAHRGRLLTTDDDFQAIPPVCGLTLEPY